MAFKMKKFSGFGKGSGKETPMNFNAGLRKASKEGKLDNNPKFKAAVDSAPVKMMDKRKAKKIKKQDILAGPVSRVISKDKVNKAKKLIRDVNQGVGKAVKRKESPKKFLGKARKFMRKNPLASAVMGGPVALAAMGDKGRAGLGDDIKSVASGLAKKKNKK